MKPTQRLGEVAEQERDGVAPPHVREGRSDSGGSPVLEVRIRVAMGDVDANRIHFATYSRYMDRLDAEFFWRFGPGLKGALAGGMGFPVVHSRCDYLHSVELDDELLVRMELTTGRTSFTEQFDFLRLPAGELVARARLVHVCTDLTTGAPRPLPSWVGRSGAG